MTTDRHRRGQRHPLHVGITFGVVAGAYAASLAAVSSFQVAAETADAAAHAPAVEAARQMQVTHDSLDARLTDAERRYNDAVAGYQAVMDRIAANQTSVGSLSETLAAIEASASNVKVPKPVQTTSRTSGGTRIQTITVTRSTTRSTTSHATTSGSGKP